MAFMLVKDRIWSRISNWKNKFLSQAVNEILLKAVAQSNIPQYEHFSSSKDLIKGD